MALELIPDLRVWHIDNIDTGEVVDGQFEPTGTTRSIASKYVRHTTLNRQKHITQFVGGTPDTITFNARLYAQSALSPSPGIKLDKLISWAKRDAVLGRPPIVLFYVGNGDPAYGDHFSVIDSITNISFDSPTVLGGLRGVSFTVNLVEWQEFKFDAAPVGESRAARAKRGDYYELLAVREYGNPLIGDIIRRKHPTKAWLNTGEVVKLSPPETFSQQVIEPKSTPLKTLTGRKETPQKALRTFHLNRLNRVFESSSIPAGF